MKKWYATWTYGMVLLAGFGLAACKKDTQPVQPQLADQVIGTFDAYVWNYTDLSGSTFYAGPGSQQVLLVNKVADDQIRVTARRFVTIDKNEFVYFNKFRLGNENLANITVYDSLNSQIGLYNKATNDLTFKARSQQGLVYELQGLKRLEK